MNRTVDAFQKNDCYAAGKIEPLEQVVDGLVREVKPAILPACRPAPAPLSTVLCWMIC